MNTPNASSNGAHAPLVRDADVQGTPPVVKAKRAKHTFMLHDPKDMSCLAKYKSTDFRYAALKAASDGHTIIWLRKTNTKEMREFEGRVKILDTPKVVYRGKKEEGAKPVTYTKEPVVKCVRKWIDSLDGTSTASQAPVDAPLADVK
jgi:hypothetical protein